MKAIVTTSANPFHYGHLSLYNEAKRIFGKNNVKVAIGRNVSKNIDFNRISYHLTPYKIQYDIAENITLADYCRNNNINYIVRGIRNSVDAEYELKLDFLNKEINNHIQTMFFPTKDIFSNISSTSINELLKYNKYNIAKKYMNEDAMYRFINKAPKFLIFFGRSCIGKTYFLENNEIFKNKQIINIDNIFWDIFKECYGNELKEKVSLRSKELVYSGKNLEKLIKKYSTREFWDIFFHFIEENFDNFELYDKNIFDLNSENKIYLLDFAHIGSYWNTIPPDLRGQLYLINLTNSKVNRDFYINKKNFSEKIKYLDKNYKDPSYFDKLINISNFYKDEK